MEIAPFFLRNKSAAFAACLLFLLLWFAPAVTAHTHGVALAPEAVTAPVIDGDLSDWKAPFIHVSADAPDWFLGSSRVYGKAVKSPKDIEAWYAVVWKGDKLYLAAVVLDDVLVKNHDPDLGQAWNQDSVEVYFTFNHDSPFFAAGRNAPYRDDAFQIRFVPFEKEPGVHGGVFLGNHSGSLGDEQFQSAVTFVSKPYRKGDRSGYVIESAIDVKALGFPGILRPGKVAGFEFVVNDADGPGGRDRMLSWSSFGNRAFQDISSFGDLLLADPQGVFTPPEGAVSGETEGYQLVPGKPVFQGVGEAIAHPASDASQGRVVYGLRAIPGARNITGMFDPNPYRPITEPTLRWCQVGYLPDGKKTAYLELPAGEKPPADGFVLRKNGIEVFRAPLRKWGTLWQRDYYLLDFYPFKGRGEAFSLSVGAVESAPFPIAEGVYEPSAAMAFQGYFTAQKCGADAEPYHKACNMDDAVQASSTDVRSGQQILQFPPVFKPGTQLDLSGGWHDAGDNNKYMGNIPLDLTLLFLIEDRFHPALGREGGKPGDYLRLAEWGSAWCLKMQDKDGGVFERVWNGFAYSGPPEKETDNKPGTGDERLLDSDKWANVTARWAAAAALGAQVLMKEDPAFAEKLKKSALRGWSYAENCPKQPDQPWAFGVYPGNESCFFWAAVELYRLTMDQKFLEESLHRLPAMMDMKPMSLGWEGNNTFALIRLYPVLPEGDTKAAVKEWLLKHVREIRKAEALDPFGVHYFAQTGWGDNGNLMGDLLELSLIQDILPESHAAASAESYRQWIYGANPAGYCFVVGRGAKKVEHQATALRQVLPGAVVPGIVDDGTGLPFYIDIASSYVTNEASIGSTASALYAGYLKSPWRLKSEVQDASDGRRETERALMKPKRPDPSVLADFDGVTTDSLWRGGGGAGKIEDSFVPTGPEGSTALRGDFRVGEWCMTSMPAGGDLSGETGFTFRVRGSGCRLRVALDDADGQDWGKEVTAPGDWQAVTVLFADMVQPAWVKPSPKPIALKGVQKLKIQPLRPDQGWFEITDIRRVDSKP